MKKFAAAALASLLISSCAGGGGSGGGLSAFGGGSKSVVSIEKEKAFKDANDVVIGGFTVGFDIEKTDSVKAGGGLLGSGFGGKSTAHSTLIGISDATMQAITDRAYNDFVSKLKAQGYNVVDRSQLVSSEDFKGTRGYDNPYEDTQGGMLGGGTTTKYFAPSSFGDVKVFMGDIPGTMGGIGFSNPGMGAATFAEKTGTRVLHVIHKVDFANSDKYGGWHTNSSSISVDQGIAVNANQTRLGIIGGQGGTFSTAIGSITLNDAITSDKKFAEVTDATSDLNKSVQVVTNVVGVLGGVGSNNSRNYEFKADTAAFQSAASDALSSTDTLLINEMKKLK